MRRFVSGKMLLVAGLSIGLGWGAAKTLYSQNAESSAAAPQSGAQPAAEEAAAGDVLDGLSWLTGDWVEEGDNPGIEFHGRWTATGAFIVRAFRVAVDDDSTLSGLQVIGWDPSEKQVRSWTFDATGGFGEETWSQLDDTWTIRSRYTLSDGSKGGAINVLTKLDDDSFTWKSVNREMNGELQPDVEEFTVVRSAAPAEAPPAPAGAPAAVPAKPAAAAPAKPAIPAKPAVPAVPGRPAVPAVPKPAVPR